MRSIVFSLAGVSALAMLTVGCADPAVKKGGTAQQPIAAPSADEVVLSVPGMT